jgi:magnesium chelatase subunit I
MKEILAQLTFEARASNEINQSSGVSVRVTINNYESLLSNAEKRAIRNAEREVVPRLSDLHSILASTVGKIELEYAGEDKKETDLVDRLINRAIMKVWDQYLKAEALARIVDHFEAGWGVEVSDQMRSEEYLDGIRQIPGLHEAVEQLGTFESPALMACAIEFALEGLHLHQKLNKDRDGGRYTYRA